jgi:hypothetical protein
MNIARSHFPKTELWRHARTYCGTLHPGNKGSFDLPIVCWSQASVVRENAHKSCRASLWICRSLNRMQEVGRRSGLCTWKLDLFLTFKRMRNAIS